LRQLSEASLPLASDEELLPRHGDRGCPQGRLLRHIRAAFTVPTEGSSAGLAAQTGLKPSTRSRCRSLLSVQILPRWGLHRLADLTHAEVAAWVAQLVAGGLAPATSHSS